MGVILGKENKRLEPNLNTIVDNPGFLNISRKILLLSDHNTVLSCRLVSQSFREKVDDPYFWIVKLDNVGQSKELHDAWIGLLQRIENGSPLENEVSRCMMHLHRIRQKISLSMWSGIMPIHIAAAYGYLEIVKTISSYQENPNAALPNGWTPIYIAAWKGYTEIFKILADKVENPNALSTGQIYLAARNGHTEIFKILADKVENPNAPLPNGWTPLHAAVRFGHTEIVKILNDKVENLNSAMPAMPAMPDGWALAWFNIIITLFREILYGIYFNTRCIF